MSTTKATGGIVETDKLQLIEAELAMAGVSPQVRERLERLEQLRRITPDKALPPMRFLFRLFGRPCFPRGELVAITGKAKSGKTFVTTMLMAACLTERALAFVRHTDFTDGQRDAPKSKTLRVLWIDTEQSEESTQDILVNRLLPMVADQSVSDNPYVFNLRGEPWQERLPMVEAAIGQYKPDLVIVDGIRDLINDINDGVLAQEVIEQLMHLATAGECCIVCVLHQNKASEDRNLRGWIGTELMNKAFEVYACEKLMPQRVFTLEQTHTRKYDIPDMMYYTVGENGLPVQTTVQVAASDTAKIKKSDLPSLNPEYIVHEDDGGWHFDIQKLFGHAMQGYEQMGHQELQLSVMQLSNVTTYQKCAQLFQQAISEKVIVKHTDSQNHVVYKPAPF